MLVANDLRPAGARSVRTSWRTRNTVRRIVRLSGVTAGDHVVEIGAGLGSLTLALAETGAAVTAVEVDPAVLPVLRAQVEPRGVRVVEADARTVDWTELLGDEAELVVPGGQPSLQRGGAARRPGARGGAADRLAAGDGPARGGGAPGRRGPATTRTGRCR